VMATVAVFLALGGAAYAATKLPKNSVGTKQIKNQAVTGVKIKKGTITGTNINLAKLGAVPSATSATIATTANTANALSAPEAMHVVGQPGQPPFEGGSADVAAPGISLQPVAYYKDKEGIVHLEGIVKIGKEETFVGLVPVFTLPPGFRPANGVLQIFQGGSSTTSAVVIAGSNASFEGHSLSGNIIGNKEALVILSGITYRAQS
jgi:hypothetical protein